MLISNKTKHLSFVELSFTVDICPFILYINLLALAKPIVLNVLDVVCHSLVYRSWICG